MNLVDLVIFIIIFSFAIEGFRKLFLVEVLDFLGFVSAFTVSLKYYQFVSEYGEQLFSLPLSYAKVLGFIVSWFVIETLFLILTRIFLKQFKRVPRIPGENILSVIPAALRGLVFVAMILILAGTFPIHPTIKKLVSNSELASQILSHTYRLEAPLKNIFGGVAEDSIAFMTVKPKTNERVDLGFKTDDFSFNESLEKDMIDLVNTERVRNNLKPLTQSLELRQIARFHSSDMLKQGYFSHISPEGKSVGDRAEQFNFNFLVIGENLAFAPSLSLAHNGLMNSPGHRANILSTDYHKIGVGAADSELYGIMFTQVFSN
ncbi:MAG: CvpA family protein [Candidatus Daviesbacteria bacterium]|nr:CvpA family protein [Candidatus Daviesbacteria bacterium]